MNTADIGKVFREVLSGDRFQYVGQCPEGCHVLLKALDDPKAKSDDRYLVKPADFDALFEPVERLDVADPAVDRSAGGAS